MEGRTKFNYGYNSGLITMKDINYMFNIINSNLSEEEKDMVFKEFAIIDANINKINEIPSTSNKKDEVGVAVLGVNKPNKITIGKISNKKKNPAHVSNAIRI